MYNSRTLKKIYLLRFLSYELISNIFQISQTSWNWKQNKRIINVLQLNQIVLNVNKNLPISSISWNQRHDGFNRHNWLNDRSNNWLEYGLDYNSGNRKLNWNNGRLSYSNSNPDSYSTVRLRLWLGRCRDACCHRQNNSYGYVLDRTHFERKKYCWITSLCGTTLVSVTTNTKR